MIPLKPYHMKIRVDPTDPEAVTNTNKIDLSLQRAKFRVTKPQTDTTVYVDEDGKQHSTLGRIMSDVEPLITRRPTDDEVFPDGKPDYKFLNEFFRREGRLTEQQVIKIIKDAKEIFDDEENLLKLPCPAAVIGDIHGQYYDLRKLLTIVPPPEEYNYIFMGDLVDRGDCSIEVLLLIYAMKICFPKKIVILRGNHESARMTQYFTFRKECLLKYSSKVYDTAMTAFKATPLVCILNDQFFCVHAGIGPGLKSLKDIREINRRQSDFTSTGVFCDIEWSDPSPTYDDNDPTDPHWAHNTDRNCSYFYSYPAVEKFLKKTDLLSVVRGHQTLDAGYRMYRKSDESGFPTVITIFSAPNYCHTYKNKAAVLIYDGTTFNVKQFMSAPAPYYLPGFLNAFQWSVPFVCEKVTDLLLSMLNVCTADELEEKTPIAKAVPDSLEQVKDEKLPPIEHAGVVPLKGKQKEEKEERKPKEAEDTTTVTQSVVEVVPGKHTAAPASPAKTPVSPAVSPTVSPAVSPAATPPVSSPSSAVKSSETETSQAEPASESLVTKHRRQLRQRIKAVHRKSRVFNLLREESESVDGLKEVSGGVMPKDYIINGRAEMGRRLNSFDDARDVDIKNEGAPPSDDEQRVLSAEKDRKYRDYIENGSDSESDSSDVIV